MALSGKQFFLAEVRHLCLSTLIFEVILLHLLDDFLFRLKQTIFGELMVFLFEFMQEFKPVFLAVGVVSVRIDELGPHVDRKGDRPEYG